MSDSIGVKVPRTPAGYLDFATVEDPDTGSKNSSNGVWDTMVNGVLYGRVSEADHVMENMVWATKTQTGAKTSGQLFAIANPLAASAFVLDVILRIRTASTGACTVDIGVAANSTTLSDTLIDGKSVAATGIHSGPLNFGTNGSLPRTWSSSQYVTCSVASGDADGFVGELYVKYCKAPNG